MTTPTTTSPAPLTRAMTALATVIALTCTLLVGVGTDADAATFRRPGITCRYDEVRVDPGVDALVATTDGYWRAHLLRWDGTTWQFLGATREGRESTRTATVGGNSFSGLSSGAYAVIVQRWNQTVHGSWEYLGWEVAHDRYGSYYCTL